MEMAHSLSNLNVASCQGERPLVCHVCSRMTSSAFLSVRSPRKAGCRISPSVVHSVNFTSPTSLGLSHCAAQIQCGKFNAHLAHRKIHLYNFATVLVMPRASSRVSNFADDLRPGSSSK